MNLQEFIDSVPTTLAAFTEATKRMAEEDPSMDPSRHRSEAWWYKDIGAYLDYLDAEEDVKWSNAPQC